MMASERYSKPQVESTNFAGPAPSTFHRQSSRQTTIVCLCYYRSWFDLGARKSANATRQPSTQLGSPRSGYAPEPLLALDAVAMQSHTTMTHLRRSASPDTEVAQLVMLHECDGRVLFSTNAEKPIIPNRRKTNRTHNQIDSC